MHLYGKGKGGAAIKNKLITFHILCFKTVQYEILGLPESNGLYNVNDPQVEQVAPTLEVFKARLDGSLSNLVYWEMSLPIAGGLELDDLKGPFQPKPFYDSMT